MVAESLPVAAPTEPPDPPPPILPLPSLLTAPLASRAASLLVAFRWTPALPICGSASSPQSSCPCPISKLCSTSPPPFMSVVQPPASSPLSDPDPQIAILTPPPLMSTLSPLRSLPPDLLRVVEKLLWGLGDSSMGLLFFKFVGINALVSSHPEPTSLRCLLVLSELELLVLKDSDIISLTYFFGETMIPIAVADGFAAHVPGESIIWACFTKQADTAGWIILWAWPRVVSFIHSVIIIPNPYVWCPRSFLAYYLENLERLVKDVDPNTSISLVRVSVVSCITIYNRLQHIAAVCRFLFRLCSKQPLIYRPLCRPLEQFISLKSCLLVVWTTAPPSSILEMDSERCSFQVWWSSLVAFPPTPPVPPDPPDYITYSLMLVSWFISIVLTLFSFGDMSIMTNRTSTASTLPSNQSLWNDWLLTSLGPIVRITLLRLKHLSPHLPLYEDHLPLYEDLLPLYEDLPLYEEHLPLYEDHLPLYEDLPLYEELLPLYEDLFSFMEVIAPLDSSFVLNGCVAGSVIKGSFDRCLIASIAILEMGNCTLVAVPISGVRSSTQDFILLNNSIVEEIRGLLYDRILFKCFVVIIPLSLYVYRVVISACYAFMAMFSANLYSFYGD